MKKLLYLSILCFLLIAHSVWGQGLRLPSGATNLWGSSANFGIYIPHSLEAIYDVNTEVSIGLSSSSVGLEMSVDLNFDSFLTSPSNLFWQFRQDLQKIAWPNILESPEPDEVVDLTLSRLPALSFLDFQIVRDDLGRVSTSVLDEFAQEFVARGIEVLTSPVLSNELDNVVSVCHLERFPVNQNSAKMKRWQQEFKDGAMGALTGIPARAVASDDDFERDWLATPKSQRIFVSYAGMDLAWAKTIKSILDQNYVTFIYQNADGEAATTAEQAGAFFAQAGQHIVIVCDKSRNSDGVIFEHLLLEAMRLQKSFEAN